MASVYAAILYDKDLDEVHNDLLSVSKPLDGDMIVEIERKLQAGFLQTLRASCEDQN